MLLGETLMQPLIFLLLLLIGFLSGLFFDFGNYIVFLCNKNKVVRVVFDVLISLVCCFIFFLSILSLSYGELRFYHILGFLLGVFLERKTLGKIIAKVSKYCYNKITKTIIILKGRQKKNNDTSKSKKSC